MKTLARIIPIFTLIALCGCSFLDKGYQQQVTKIPAQTNSVTVLETNVVQIAPAVTNATGEVTPPKFEQQITPVVTVKITPERYETNLVALPAVQGGIQLAQSLPLPYAGVAGGLFGLFYSAYAAIRNRQVAKALVMGIESGRQLLQNTPEGQKLDAALKDELIKHQEAAGVLGAVSGLVASYTGNTVK